MKRSHPIVFFLAAGFALAFSPNSIAQPASGTPTQASGEVSGRVQNVVTGRYLNRARISVKDTDIVVFTDEFGIYRLTNLRPGPAVVSVFYTGLDPQEKVAEVPASGALELDFELSSQARYGQDPNLVKLDPFVVASDKEANTDAIATNEQRFAANIKNVISTDSLGDVLGSSAGDFLKFIPGLTTEYDNADITAISMRGMGGGLSNFYVDGAPGLSANNGATRGVEMRTLAISNISRVDVTKVPTPADPADTLGGAVNMISKSVFERSRAELRFGVNFVGNSKDFTFRKTPQAKGDTDTYKILPGFDFDYTLPVSKNFGLVVTGMQSSKYNEQLLSRKTWNPGGTSTGASFSSPFFQQFNVRRSPRNEVRTIFSLNADWRVTRNSVVSFGGRWSRYRGIIEGTNMTWNAGTTGTSSIANGVPLSFDATRTVGATGRGSLSISADAQYFQEDSYGTNASYRFDNGKWKIDASASYASSSRARTNQENGKFFTGVNTANVNPVRVTFTEIGGLRPNGIEVLDNSNNPVDAYNINNYAMTTATDVPQKQVGGSEFGKLNVGRRLDWFSFPNSIQIGTAYRLRTLDARRQSITWNFTGANTSPAPYLFQNFVNQDLFLGFKTPPSISSERAYAAFVANPSLFSKTPAQLVTEETFRIANSQYIKETVGAYYAQWEARFLKNRLRLLTGVRFEKTEDAAEGPLIDPNAVFVRNANGTFAHTAAGARIRKPEAGAAGSIEELRLVRHERASLTDGSYHGYYPSVHLTYDITANFLARLAYAKTYGRPDLSQIIPTTTINEADLSSNPNGIPGSISTTNTGLKPWTADNYDLSLEYYGNQGGSFSAGIFRKDIKDFFGAVTKIATAEDLAILGLDNDYVGWNLTTTFNSGDARVSGCEFSARQPLQVLGELGRHFTVFANGTLLRLQGNPYASFGSFIPKTANLGVSFTWKRLTIAPRWNYRGLNKLTANTSFGPDGYNYIKDRTTLDLSASYQLSKRFSLAGSMTNALNVPLTNLQYGSLTPDYARRSTRNIYGAAFALGLKGTF